MGVVACRQPEYQCEQHMLELQFFTHFTDANKEKPSMLFKVSAEAGLQEQGHQLNFVHCLSDFKLVCSVCFACLAGEYAVAIHNVA